jgi:glycosyltransferase involved in cell wall biosynthesis
MPFAIIVVPCYNEEQRLEVDRLVQFNPAGAQGDAPPDVPPGSRTDDLRIELLFVNDGSGDGTLATLQAMRDRAPDRIDVLDLRPNRGKAEAVRNGFLKAFEKGPDYIGFWDADLATPLEEIPLFCDILRRHEGIDLVFGSRVKLMGRMVERKTYRHYFGRVFATAVSVTLDMPIYDSQCGAKLFRNTPALREVFSTPFLSRWVFDVEILARFRQVFGEAGVDIASRVYELPLRQWRDVHGSKLKMKDALRAYVDLARIRETYLKA